jgi:NAD(P)-dependent dehydrogenase (short-subunit alcohol dehydrogenase family)
MDRIFENKVALVTGSSYGIGKATALAFARRGARVVLSDWKDDVDALKTIEAEGGEAVFFRCDVADEERVRALVQHALERFGRLDYAFNNAGIEGERGDVSVCSAENWQHVLGVNLTGPWNCMKHEIPAMLESGGGCIVNNASIAGLVGFQGMPAYVASKHGLVGLTRNVALDFARQGIRVNAVCPGVIRTPMVQRVMDEQPEMIAQITAGKPMGRVGEPEEIADAVVYLCSDASSFMTGQALAIDGGWTVQ